MRGGVVQLFDEEDPLRSDVTIQAAALLTLGIPPKLKEFFHVTYESIRGEIKFHSVWTFGGISFDKRFDTVQMRRAWGDGAWLLANPKHPLAILRTGLTYHRAFNHTPKYTIEERNRIETPDTWLESGCHNLIWLLRQIPLCAKQRRGIIRFAPVHLAMVPANLPETSKTRLIKYAESTNPDVRARIRAAA
jgi:hypothetical protein